MTATITPYQAAAVQAEPVWNDRDAGITKTIDLITEARRQQVSLVVFPELWIPGYPLWLFLGHPMGGLATLGPRLIGNTLEVGGTDWKRLSQAAANNAVTVVMGAALLDHDRMFMGQCLFTADGRSAVRYKIDPTSFEKTLFKSGDPEGLVVHDLPGIGRLGFLQCFEHLQPECRMQMQQQSEQVHAASWPVLAGPDPQTYQLSVESNLSVSRSYAVENGAYVLASMAMISADVLADLAGNDPARRAILHDAGRGCAQVFAPNGMQIGATLPANQEGLVIAGIDLGMIPAAKLLYDPMGLPQSRKLRDGIAVA